MEKKYRISKIVGVLMVILALVVDASQFLLDFIPVIGIILSWCIDIVAWLTFYVWLKIKNVSLTEGKKFTALVIGSLIELLPIINAVPAWTLTMFIIVSKVRAEDLLIYQKDQNKKEAEQKRKEEMLKEQYIESSKVELLDNTPQNIPLDTETELWVTGKSPSLTPGRSSSPLYNLKSNSYSPSVAKNDSFYEKTA